MLKTVIFIGRSGAGKGTQSGFLRDFLKKENHEMPVLYIETGAYFREFVKDGGYTQERAKIVNSTGGRQADFLAVWMWSNIFVNKLKGDEHIIFDGTPRSLGEAKMLDTAISFYERKNPTVIFLDVSREWAEERLRGRGRPDDKNQDAINRRLAYYEDDVIHAIQYYRENPAYNFIDINGEQTPEEVHEEIKKKLQISIF